MDGVSGLLSVGTSDVIPKLGEPLCLVRMQATLDVRQMARNTRKGLKEGQRWRREKKESSVSSIPSWSTYKKCWQCMP